MADTVIVRIDLPRLTYNLSTGEGVEQSPDDVAAFLREVGFIDLGSGRWQCEEISLRALNRAEWTIDVPRPAGHCWCGYDLTGNKSGVCPECGRAGRLGSSVPS